jgi:hypothetical protein
MRIYPPNIRIGYKGKVCDRFKSTISNLEKECYRSFVEEVDRYKETCPARIFVKEGMYSGKVLKVNWRVIDLLTHDKKKVHFDLNHIQYIQFDSMD